MGDLGTVDPFALEIDEQPPGSDRLFVHPPGAPGACLPLGLAGLNLVGAGQALLALAFRWMCRAGRPPPDEEPPIGEVRLMVSRREGRLLSALLRRHLRRLPQPPAWMPALLESLEDIDFFLQWGESAVPGGGEDQAP